MPHGALVKLVTPEVLQHAPELSGARRLIDPKEMGSLFKVLALTQPGAPSPLGFDGERT